MSRYTPELPTPVEVDRIGELIENVEAISPRHEVTGWRLICSHSSPWLRIKLEHEPAYAGMVVDYALWRANGTVYALDSTGMIDTVMLEAAW